ncbi:MAG TPA: hypothetical protein PKJ51_01590 [Methanothrix sp.]|jgi:hypothetical protein|nr:hypothetical protein [Methanothrix sp.]
MVASDLALALSGAILFLAAVAFAVLAIKFKSLKHTVVISIFAMGELMVLLARWDDLEKPEEAVARIMAMEPDEVRLEIERGRLISLIGRKAAEILGAMKASVPDAAYLFEPIEDDVYGR